MRDHTELRAFELADEVAVLLYRVTARSPKEELYVLTPQMCRAAVSRSLLTLWRDAHATPRPMSFVFSSSLSVL